jgi:hypothetical protein
MSAERVIEKTGRARAGSVLGGGALSPGYSSGTVVVYQSRSAVESMKRKTQPAEVGARADAWPARHRLR